MTTRRHRLLPPGLLPLGVAALTAIALVGTTAGAATKTTKKTTTKKPAAAPASTAAPAPAPAPPPAPAAPTTAAAPPASAKKSGDTMTIALASAPSTLDPAKAPAQPFQIWPNALAYEPLVRLNPDLTYSPGLAQSWSFDGLNETLTFKLRAGVKFNDGTPVDAQAVANFFSYWAKNSPASPTQAGTVDTVTAGPNNTVIVKQKNPNPNVLRVFSENFMAGSVISPAGMADQSKVATASYGAGPYNLDSSATVLGSVYTFVPNKNYYDPTMQYWKKIVFRVIPDTNARVQAVQTGQVDFASVDGTVIGASRSAGLNVSVGAAGATFGVLLADRQGTISKPLADVDVRRALNYALDRKAICRAALGEEGGDPTNNYPTIDYDDALDKLYPFDESKAKQLLSDAGFGSGFKLTLEATNLPPFNILGQAVAGSWKKIGVDVEIATNPSVPASQTAQRARQYAAYIYGYGTLPSVNVAASFVGGAANSFNPFSLSPDAQMRDWLNQAPVLGAADATKLYKKVWARAVDQALNVNLCTFNTVTIANKRLANWQNPKVGITPFPNLISAA